MQVAPPRAVTTQHLLHQSGMRCRELHLVQKVERPLVYPPAGLATRERWQTNELQCIVVGRRKNRFVWMSTRASPRAFRDLLATRRIKARASRDGWRHGRLYCSVDRNGTRDADGDVGVRKQADHSFVSGAATHSLVRDHHVTPGAVQVDRVERPSQAILFSYPFSPWP
jgi:hypothetical protein